MTWEIFLGIVVLVEFLLLIVKRKEDTAKPMNDLNTSVTQLKCSVDSLNENLTKTDKRLNGHSERLDDHEHRITVLEAHEKRSD